MAPKRAKASSKGPKDSKKAARHIEREPARDLFDSEANSKRKTTVVSPDITLEEATPVRVRDYWSPSSSSQTTFHERETPPARSSSQSSASSGSSTSRSPSPPLHSARSSTPSLLRSITASRINLSAQSPPPLPRSLSAAHLATFAPPFYNRPPTPLPPSPSLTSLLRPSFSATPSRPTTPSESEPEAPYQSGTTARGSPTKPALLGHSNALTSTSFLHLNALGNSSRSSASATTSAPPVPRASPKVPTYEYYGFVLYLTSSFSFLGYILWSYLPSPFLHQLGIYYYPDRWWSLAIPAWIVMAVGFVYVGLAGYNSEVLTLPIDALGAVVDEVGVVAVVDQDGRLEGKYRRTRPRGAMGKEAQEAQRRNWSWSEVWNESTDAVLDVPIGGVCEVLYGDG